MMNVQSQMKQKKNIKHISSKNMELQYNKQTNKIGIRFGLVAMLFFSSPILFIYDDKAGVFLF